MGVGGGIDDAVEVGFEFGEKFEEILAFRHGEGAENFFALKVVVFEDARDEFAPASVR